MSKSENVLPITIDGLRKTGAKPHFFGLGFIQLKIDPIRRVHFYHPELMANVPPEELHDHRYDFTSRVIRGNLLNEIWGFRPSEDGSEEMVRVSCDPKKPLPEGEVAIRGDSYKIVSFSTIEGAQYSIDKDQFHRVETGVGTITYLERGPVVKDFATVIRGSGVPEVCPFDVSLSEGRCWEMMADLLGEKANPGYHLKDIPRGVIGEISKITEEVMELEDAAKQGVRLMELIELSDIIGAVEAYLGKNHTDITLTDLIRMSDVTKRAFRNGDRS